MAKQGSVAQGAGAGSLRVPILLGHWAACVILATFAGQRGIAQEIEARLIFPALDREKLKWMSNYYVAFSPGGKTLAYGTTLSGVRVWNLAGGKKCLTLVSEDEPVGPQGIAFSPDGKRLAVSGFERGIVRLLDVLGEKKSEILTLDEDRWVSRVAFAPDGKTLAAGLVEDRSARKKPEVVLWELETRKVRAILAGHRFNVRCLAFTPDSKLLATSSALPDILLWRVDTGKPYGRLSEGPMLAKDRGSSWHLAFTPDGKTLAGAATKGRVNLWDIKTGNAILLYYRDEDINGLALSPDGRTLAFVDDFTIHLFDMFTHEERAALRSRMPKRHCPSLAFSPDGRTLAAGRFDGYITLFDLAGVKGVKTPDTAALARLWSRLRPGDSRDAYRAIRTLSAFPRQAVPFLRQQLRPPPPATTAQRRVIDRFVSDLDSEDFDVRQKAREQLAKAGALAESALRRALAGRPSAEVRKQAKELLKGIALAQAPYLLQRLRALEVLEHMDDAGARALLAELAKTAPEARVRDDAKTALQRVRKRPPPTIIKPLPPDAPPRPSPSSGRKGAPRTPPPPTIRPPRP